MAKFTATAPLNIRLPGGFEVSGAAGVTHRIPDSLYDEFLRDQVPLIPGGVTWITTDEMASAISPSAISTAALTAVAARFKGGPWFDVRAYGATGDGTTDDTSSVQAAIAAAPASAVVYFPPGTYSISTVSITTLALTLAGVGTVRDGTIRIGVSTGSFVNYDTQIDGLRFIRQAASSTVNAIELQRCWGARIRNNWFENYNAAVSVVALDLGGTTDKHVARVQISGNRGDACKYLLKIAPNLNTAGVYAGADFSVVDNSFIARIAHIYAEGLDGLICTGNTFFFPDNTDSANNTEKLDNIYIDKAVQIVIDGNQLFEAGRNGIWLNRVQNAAVVGNNIPYCGQRLFGSGIKFSGGDPSATTFTMSTIIGNTILFPTRAGISIEDNCSYITVSGNQVRDPGNQTRYIGTPGSTTNFGLQAGASTSYITALGNVITAASSASAAQSLLGTFSNLVYTRQSDGALIQTGGTLIPDAVFTTGNVDGNVFRYQGDTTRNLRWGSGTPEGSIVASPGAIYSDTTTSAKFAYIKSTGTSNTGWVGIPLGFIGAAVYATAAQTLTSGADTAITFGNEALDTDAFHDTASNTSRITIPATLNGRKVQLGGTITMDANSAGGRWLAVRKSGATMLAFSEDAQGSATQNCRLSVVTEPLQVATGDYFELVVNQNSGGNLATVAVADYSPRFWLHVVGY